MKKIIALALAGILAATAAYTALAVDEEPTEEVSAPVITADEVLGNVQDVLDALENDEQAQAIADDFLDAINKGAANEDINALLLELASYINNKGFDVNDLKNKEKAKAFVGEFLEDCGVDSEALGKAFDAAGEVFDNVFSGTGTTDNNGTSSEGTTSSSDDYYYNGGYVDYGVDSTTIPDTGIID